LETKAAHTNRDDTQKKKVAPLELHGLAGWPAGGLARGGGATQQPAPRGRHPPGQWHRRAAAVSTPGTRALVFHSELVLALGRSKGEIDWALQYLVRECQVESRLTELPARKPVHRYRQREGSTT